MLSGMKEGETVARDVKCIRCGLSMTVLVNQETDSVIPFTVENCPWCEIPKPQAYGPPASEILKRLESVESKLDKIIGLMKEPAVL